MITPAPPPPAACSAHRAAARRRCRPRSHQGRCRFFGQTRGGRYSWARYYHPGLARFISEDPASFGGGDTNLYGYVYNDPLRFVDPFGLGPLPPWLKAVLKALPDVIPKPEGTGELVGDIVGGVGGGALGTFLIRHPVGTVAGAIVGAHFGGQIGKSLFDDPCAGQLNCGVDERETYISAPRNPREPVIKAAPDPISQLPLTSPLLLLPPAGPSKSCGRKC